MGFMHARSLEVDSWERKYFVYVPEGCIKAPAVIILHGAGGTAEKTLHSYGWKDKADEESFVLIIPEALPNNPKEPAVFSTNPTAWKSGSKVIQGGWNDTVFIGAVIDDAIHKDPIDSTRIYCTGFSSGASMTFKVGVELSEKIAAIAPVSGHLWGENPKPVRPLSLLLIAGAADPILPLNGGETATIWGGKRYNMPPMQESVDKWTGFIQASKEPTSKKSNNGVTFLQYGPGKTGKIVLFVIIEGQGHEWPGSPRLLPEQIAGPVVNSLNATNYIWEFFKKQ